MSGLRETGKWLRELGAIRPMAPASDEVLVLGKWRDGHYPIQWQYHRARSQRNYNEPSTVVAASESWSLFGFMVLSDLTKADCERILRATGDTPTP